jgi:hypothetical protein
MSVRESMSSKPAFAVVIAVICLLIGAWAIFHQLRPPAELPEAQVYYSDDEGVTWFPDSASRIPPYDHNGKQAVRCYVFNAGGKDFAGYLKKFTPELISRIKQNLPSGDAEMMAGTLIKRPGNSPWVASNDPTAQAIMNPTDPAHPGAETNGVLP